MSNAYYSEKYVIEWCMKQMITSEVLRVFSEISQPEVVYCPDSTDVQLQPHEMSHPIYWKEPKFASTSELEIFRSKVSRNLMVWNYA